MIPKLRCTNPFFPLLLLFMGLLLTACGGSDKAEPETRKTSVRQANGVRLNTAGPIAKEAASATRFSIIPEIKLVGAGGSVQGDRRHSGDQAIARRESSGASTVGSTYSYVIVSASLLPMGARVSVIRADVSRTCVLPGIVSPFSPVASAVVSKAGSISLEFSDPRATSFVEIIYIDSNDSGHLDAGDQIWGSNPKDPAGVCFSPKLASINRVNWDGVAAVIGGVSTYSGDGQDFLASAAGESQVPAGSYIIGETGYGNL